MVGLDSKQMGEDGGAESRPPRRACAHLYLKASYSSSCFLFSYLVSKGVIHLFINGLWPVSLKEIFARFASHQSVWHAFSDIGTPWVSDSPCAHSSIVHTLCPIRCRCTAVMDSGLGRPG